MQAVGNNFKNIYSLTISIDMEDFTFFINNPKNEIQLSVEHYHVNPSISLTANLKEAFSKLDFLQVNYQAVRILVAERYTLVPLEGFEDEQAEAILKYNYPELESRQVLFNVLSHTSAVAVYSIDKSAYQYLLEMQPHAHFFLATESAIDHFAEKSRHSRAKQMYIHFVAHKMEITCFDYGHLLFANTFSETDVNDQLYYILYTWKQLGFDPEKDEANIVGKHKEKLTEILQRYIRHIAFPEEQNDFSMLRGNANYYFKAFATNRF